MSEKHPIRVTPAAVIADGEVQPTVGHVATWGTEGAEWSRVSGLPEQWSEGDNGDVTGTVDDITKTTLTLRAPVGQEFTPLLLLEDELGHEMWSAGQEADAIGATHHFGLRDSTNAQWAALFKIQIDNNEAALNPYQEASLTLGTAHNVNGVIFDTFWNSQTAADNYSLMTLTVFDDQPTPAWRLSKASGGNALFELTGTGALDLPEQSAPAAPAANTARVYACDDGGGKTQLSVRFPTGAVQVIAEESGAGPIITSPNGTRYRIVVSNAGVLSTVAV